MNKKTVLQWALMTTATFLIAGMALISARHKMHDYSALSPLRVGLPVSALEFLGNPVSVSDRELVYLLPDQSNLVIAVENGEVFSAMLQLKTPLKIQDPSLRGLTFVQMRMDEFEASPTWFYAAAADEGRIFKVSSHGLIQTITWVKPFSTVEPSRNLQALLQDFTVQQPIQM